MAIVVDVWGDESMNFEQGSEWRKWDLHVHTKGTRRNDNFLSASFEEFCDRLFKKALEKGIAAIGITDYFSIENYSRVIGYLGSIESNMTFSSDEKKELEIS